MRRKLKLFNLNGFIILSMLFLISCGGMKNEETEPNNTIDKANDVPLGTPFSLSVNPKGDNDWFKVTLSEQGYLRVQANQVPEGIGVEVSFALYEEWEGNKVKTIRGWHKLPDAVFIPKAGVYYFMIKDDWDDKFSDQPLQIKVDFLKEFDNTEPNNVIAEAHLLGPDNIVKPAIYPVGDHDWFKIKLEKQGYLTVQSNNVPAGITPEVKYIFYDEWSDPKENIIRNWKKAPDACFIPKAGEYFILLHDDWNDKSSEQPFDLKVRFLEEMDINEPNNTSEEAKIVKRGDTLTIAIFPTGDQDYYQFSVPDGNQINFMIKDVPANISPEIKFLTVDEKNPDKLKEISKWVKMPVGLEVKPGQKYYFHIHDDWDDKSSPKTFEVKIK